MLSRSRQRGDFISLNLFLYPPCTPLCQNNLDLNDIRVSYYTEWSITTASMFYVCMQDQGQLYFFQGLTVLFVGTMGLVGNVLAFATILSMSRPLREGLLSDQTDALSLSLSLPLSNVAASK